MRQVLLGQEGRVIAPTMGESPTAHGKIHVELHWNLLRLFQSWHFSMFTARTLESILLCKMLCLQEQYGTEQHSSWILSSHGFASQVRAARSCSTQKAFSGEVVWRFSLSCNLKITFLVASVFKPLSQLSLTGMSLFKISQEAEELLERSMAPSGSAVAQAPFVFGNKPQDAGEMSTSLFANTLVVGSRLTCIPAPSLPRIHLTSPDTASFPKRFKLTWL